MPPSGLLAALLHARVRYTTEDELQQRLTTHLTGLGFPVQREFPLAAGERIDLMIDGVGVEVKTQGATNKVEQQLWRYDQTGVLDYLILATTRRQHADIYRTRFTTPFSIVVLPLW